MAYWIILSGIGFLGLMVMVVGLLIQGQSEGVK